MSVESPLHTPSVSVVIPCYNQGRFLGDAVASLKAQTIPDWECVIVDDGSTDDTASRAAALARSDDRIRVVRQPNRGLSGARNAGLSLSRGRFVQFLDADDVLAPVKFEHQLIALSNTSVLALSYTDYRYCPEDDIDATATRDDFGPPEFVTSRPLWDIAARWETELSIPAHCFLLDARFFREYKIRFDESLPSHEDWDCWIQVFALDPAVAYVPEKLAIYRLHERAMTGNFSAMSQGFDAALQKQLRVFAGDPVMAQRLAQKRVEMRAVYASTKPSFRRRVTWHVRRLLGRSEAASRGRRA